MFDNEILIFALIGFVAQIVDGALGMAFGVIASSALMAFGAPPAMASAAVHGAEIVTTGVSGLSHWWNKNIDRGLFLRLVIPGVLGGVVGAYILTGLPEGLIRPFVAVYLAVMAGLVILRLFGRAQRHWKIPPQALGGAGGFLDAIGGGGWGPIVSSTLIAKGDEPRRSIGSVNAAEFFVAASISVAFLTTLDLASYGRIILGLIIGGVLAAPLAGFLLRVLPRTAATALVAVVITALSVYNFYKLVA